MEVSGATTTLNTETLRLAREESEIRAQEASAPRKQSVDTTQKIPNRDELRKVLEEREKMVLKPGEVTLEERLSQVISLDEIKRLLFFYGPFASPRLEDQKGRLVDLKS